MSDAEDLLSPDQFDSFEIKLKVRNLTSGTEVPASATVQLTELEDHHLAMQLPPRSCAMGHRLLVELDVVHSKASQCFQLSSTCTVTLSESAGPDADHVRVQLVQYDEASLKRLHGLYAARQDEIDRFLQSARGY